MNATGFEQRAATFLRPRLLLPAAGLLLSCLILAMLWSAHASSVAREREVTLRMEEDVRGAAATLGYFFYERDNDMRIASDNRQLLTYFENKALGMSEEYGLLASRLSIEEHLAKLVQDRRVGGEPIYSALALVDREGAVIGESRAGPHTAKESPWRKFLPESEPHKPLFAVDYEAQQPGIVLRQPVNLGGQVVGHILARIPLERVLPLLVRSPEAGVHLYCVTEGPRLAATLHGVFDPALPGRLVEPGPGRPVSSQRVRAMDDGEKAEHLAIWASVPQTPLRVLSLVNVRELLGAVSPWLITGVSALLCAFTLAALWLAWRANSAQLVLGARLEEKTQAERTIRQKASELEQLLDSLPGDAFFKDAKGRYITGNASLCALVGLTREELSGKTDHELFPAGLADKYVADDARILEGGLERLETEDQVPSLQGLRDVLTRKVAVHNAEGAVIGLIGLGYDITEKKRVERELQAAYAEMERRVEQRTEQLAYANTLLQTEIAERKQAHREANLVLSAVSALLVGVDMQGRVSKWNQAASEIFQLAEEDSLGREFASLPLPWEWDRVLEGLAQCSLERQTVKINNLWYERADGKEGFLFVGLSPILDEGGGLKGVLVLGTDITDFKVLEAQLSQAQKLESIGQLAAGIAHEINTPTQYVGDTISFLRDANADILAVMDRVAELAATPDAGCGAEALQDLADKLEDIEYPFLREEMPLSFSRAKDGIQRVSGIVRAMRSFSHPGQGEKKGVDLNEALMNTITVSRNEWKYVADMETDLDPQLPQVICLPAEMNQVFLNIVVNAAHAVEEAVRGTARKGVIRIATAQEEGGVRISISDTGAGIPEAVRGKIFDPFFTTKEVGKGTGQGLTLAYDIVVNKHGGSISFDTEHGRGTTFHIHLPLGW
ncbi:MAG TPA: PAS domain-containing protein [Humidesulfovibrio sp.]|uniref:PAS domain-containing protein n=1 Tax=Humidesulfovibrio sp. TaxID=2910988 RepID=UPI002BFB26D6|nr:PAS domain-containing protein [Humidesulfovibrio sp.]HWR03816.1 PAS domain-containing protein [Humidesulfovibrio sp.]